MPGYLLCQSDARTIPLPDKSVHMCVTSPPYFGLRDYSTGRWDGGDDPACDHTKESHTPQEHVGSDGKLGRHNTNWDHRNEASYRSQCRKCGARRVDRQIGLEASIGEYVDVMVRVFREVKRVLRDDGTCWINLGDSYISNGCGWGGEGNKGNSGAFFETHLDRRRLPGLAPKNLLGMPWRVAFALQSDGWVLRSDIIWSKANPMPESVTDRPTKSHEYLFLLSKKSTYFYDAEAVREPQTESSFERARYDRKNDKTNKGRPTGHDRDDNGREHASGLNALPYTLNPAGRNMRSVISLPTESWPGAHFATFPRKLVEPCIKAGSSERGCCPRCGAGWTRSIEQGELVLTTNLRAVPTNRGDAKRDAGNRLDVQPIPGAYRTKSTTGWHASCSCPPHAPVPCTILDPFVGSGTVCVVANALGRHAIGLDLSRQYLTQQAQRRLERPHSRPLRPARAEPAMPLFGEEN